MNDGVLSDFEWRDTKLLPVISVDLARPGELVALCLPCRCLLTLLPVDLIGDPHANLLLADEHPAARRADHGIVREQRHHPSRVTRCKSRFTSLQYRFADSTLRLSKRYKPDGDGQARPQRVTSSYHCEPPSNCRPRSGFHLYVVAAMVLL